MGRVSSMLKQPNGIASLTDLALSRPSEGHYVANGGSDAPNAVADAYPPVVENTWRQSACIHRSLRGVKMDAGDTLDASRVGVSRFVFTQQVTFVHARDWSQHHTFDDETCIVADGWAYLVNWPRGGSWNHVRQEASAAEDLPLCLVAVRTHDGFKVYWGDNTDTYPMVRSWGIRIHHEEVARAYFPMLADVEWYRE